MIWSLTKRQEINEVLLASFFDMPTTHLNKNNRDLRVLLQFMGVMNLHVELCALVWHRSFGEDEPAAGIIGKGEGEEKGKGKGKKVWSRKVANYRRKFLVVCWIVLDGQLYTCPN